MGQQADAGKAIFAAVCAKCHGDNGQGVSAPAIIGASATLAKYKTAQGLLDYVDTAMPADAPGSLAQRDYSQILAFLLVQNGFTSPDTLFDAGQLANLPLAK